ncbi:bacteriophage CI repressor [Campylobacter concisus]|jgi:bacteriophage CI repressor helix-turn-helix domain|uniref:Bacteriophage CI repressor n=1 Tax=Campylobacter concisus TaxID=199 RepID=A0A7S9NFG8_9BACT|nr:helix-turn-helix domain-containing protein [Campylobacter concisus]QPH84810.1 bacteriophage CI repressor [Campylobacter concisus]DAS61810.1 MAG TPA: CI repressor [Caudoviricetes sp.]
MENLEAILARMRAVLGVKTDKQMCEILEIQYGTLDNWKNRKKIPRGRLLEIATKLNVTPEYLESGTHISNNTNSVIVNGSNNGSIVNGHQVKVSDEFMEFAELFKKYGNSELLKQWTESLAKIKNLIEGDKK